MHSFRRKWGMVDHVGRAIPQGTIFPFPSVSVSTLRKSQSQLELCQSKHVLALPLSTRWDQSRTAPNQGPSAASPSFGAFHLVSESFAFWSFLVQLVQFLSVSVFQYFGVFLLPFAYIEGSLSCLKANESQRNDAWIDRTWNSAQPWPDNAGRVSWCGRPLCEWLKRHWIKFIWERQAKSPKTKVLPPLCSPPPDFPFGRQQKLDHCFDF